MHKYSGLKHPPFFNPCVGDFYNGMLITIPIFTRLLKQGVTANTIFNVLNEHYKSEKFVRVMPLNTKEYFDNGFLSPMSCNNTNYVDIFVFEHNNEILLISRLDNLGKGASGAAIQTLNLIAGVNENTV